MSLAYRYAMRQKHIKRKKLICRDVYGFDWYRNGDGHYNKGKIHCSCPMCASKTNDKKLIKSKGPVSKSSHIGRPSTTHNRYGRRNWTVSAKKRQDSMNFSEMEWYGGSYET